MRTVLSCSTIFATTIALSLASAAHAQSPVGGGDGETTGAAPAGTPAAAPAATTTTEVPSGESATDVAEKDHKTYYFVGARYRGTIIPKFMVNMFVGEGATFYSNMVGIEVDIRKDHFSMIPALNYIEYGFDPVLFLDKSGQGGEAIPGNFSSVHSNLAGIYLTLDLLWSVPVHKHIDFEYGLGVGVGALFGNIYNNWVYFDPNGSLSSSGGRKFSICPSEGFGGAGSGCNKADHKNPDTAKVNDYQEKTWAGGGSVPNVFLHLALPQLGLRIKTIKQMEMRIGGGFSLTGFWFGISGDYGFESSDKPKTAPTGSYHGPIAL